MIPQDTIDMKKLHKFYLKVQPAGPGWAPFSNGKSKLIFPSIVNMLLGSIMVILILFGIGYIIFNQLLIGLCMICISIGIFYLILKRI